MTWKRMSASLPAVWAALGHFNKILGSENLFQRVKDLEITFDPSSMHFIWLLLWQKQMSMLTETTDR